MPDGERTQPSQTLSGAHGPAVEGVQACGTAWASSAEGLSLAPARRVKETLDVVGRFFDRERSIGR